MATVPNTNTFTLQNVVAITGGNSLAAAFANADNGLFDLQYKGNKDRLSNFRNYGIAIKLTLTSALFDIDGNLLSGSDTFNVISGGDWTSQGGAGWAVISPASGSAGTRTVTVSVGYNGEGYNRGSGFNFLYNGIIYATFSIVQQG